MTKNKKNKQKGGGGPAPQPNVGSNKKPEVEKPAETENIAVTASVTEQIKIEPKVDLPTQVLPVISSKAPVLVEDREAENDDSSFQTQSKKKNKKQNKSQEPAKKEELHPQSVPIEHNNDIESTGEEISTLKKKKNRNKKNKNSSNEVEKILPEVKNNEPLLGSISQPVEEKLLATEVKDVTHEDSQSSKKRKNKNKKSENAEKKLDELNVSSQTQQKKTDPQVTKNENKNQTSEDSSSVIPHPTNTDTLSKKKNKNKNKGKKQDNNVDTTNKEIVKVADEPKIEVIAAEKQSEAQSNESKILTNANLKSNNTKPCQKTSTSDEKDKGVDPSVLVVKSDEQKQNNIKKNTKSQMKQQHKQSNVEEIKKDEPAVIQAEQSHSEIPKNTQEKVNKVQSKQAVSEKPKDTKEVANKEEPIAINPEQIKAEKSNEIKEESVKEKLAIISVEQSKVAEKISDTKVVAKNEKQVPITVGQTHCEKPKETKEVSRKEDSIVIQAEEPSVAQKDVSVTISAEQPKEVAIKEEAVVTKLEEMKSVSQKDTKDVVKKLEIIHTTNSESPKVEEIPAPEVVVAELVSPILQPDSSKLPKVLEQPKADSPKQKPKNDKQSKVRTVSDSKTDKATVKSQSEKTGVESINKNILQQLKPALDQVKIDPSSEALKSQDSLVKPTIAPEIIKESPKQTAHEVKESKVRNLAEEDKVKSLKSSAANKEVVTASKHSESDDASSSKAETKNVDSIQVLKTPPITLADIIKQTAPIETKSSPATISVTKDTKEAANLLSEALSELIDAATDIPLSNVVETLERVPPDVKPTNVAQLNPCIAKSIIEDIPTEMKASASKNAVGSDFVPSVELSGIKSHDPLDELVTQIIAEPQFLNFEEIIGNSDPPESQLTENRDGVQTVPNKLLEILDAVLLATPEQKEAMKKAGEKYSQKSNNAALDIKGSTNTGTIPKTQPDETPRTEDSVKKPQIPPKPEHLLKKQQQKNQFKEAKTTPIQKPQQIKQPGNTRKPDIAPKPSKVPPVSQKSSAPKNLHAVPPQTNSNSLSWNCHKTQSEASILPPLFSNLPKNVDGVPPIPNFPTNALDLISSLGRGDFKLPTNRPALPISSKTITPQELIDEGIDEDEDFVEYKFIPRHVFLATNCLVCQMPLQKPIICNHCRMVSYCTEKHLLQDENSHKQICYAIRDIAKKRGGHVYNNAKILGDDEFRTLRVHTLTLCQAALNRQLQPFEREILLFPRLCSKSTCREWHQEQLSDCKTCHQISYCTEHADHLPESHARWCKFFLLYQKFVIKQKKYGRIEPQLPSKIFNRQYEMAVNIDSVFNDLYKNFSDLKDDCLYAMLTQLATAPLTALYGSQKCGLKIEDTFTIHLIGAEIQFEADTLDKWETFFLHLVPSLMELKIVFIGPELNSENLPLDILSRIRMCRSCRQSCRSVRFDFQCGKFYHSYYKTSSYTKPDLICFFNPGLHRSTGFKELDTWPDTIEIATSIGCPIVVTSYTELESPQDFSRLESESTRSLKIVHPPEINPFSSLRPERNFISDESVPMIFKNYYYFIVT